MQIKYSEFAMMQIQNTIDYCHVTQDVIYIVAFWNMRKEPKKLSRLIDTNIDN